MDMVILQAIAQERGKKTRTTLSIRQRCLKPFSEITTNDTPKITYHLHCISASFIYFIKTNPKLVPFLLFEQIKKNNQQDLQSKTEQKI